MMNIGLLLMYCIFLQSCKNLTVCVGGKDPPIRNVIIDNNVNNINNQHKTNQNNIAETLVDLGISTNLDFNGETLHNQHRYSSSAKCQRINVEQCKDLPYNHTRFPNLVGDENEKDAENRFNTFDPLIKIRCSSQLKFFLCSIYFPMCTDKVPIPIGPCRPLCERVRRKCEPLLKEFGFPWPASMDCSKFPQENNHDAMCMKGPTSDEEIPVAYEELEHEQHDMYPNTKCSRPNTIYMNRTAQCIPLCESNHGYTTDDRESASATLFIMSLICIALTSVCLLTFCTRQNSLVALSEISLFFCSVSFCISSIIYLFSLLYRDQISCVPYASKMVFIVSGIQHVPCTTAAISSYYFGTTGRLWWFILCCTWNKCTQRQQDNLILKVHALVWGLPLAVVMLALMAQSIYADPLSGVCLVGGENKVVEAVFISLREFIILFCCVIPLLFGCLALIGSAQASDYSVGSNGFIGSIYPMAAALLLLGSLQHISSSKATTWNSVTALKLLADPVLGTLSSSACFIQVLLNIFRINRSPVTGKYGYQPAVPQIPQPPIPIGVYSMARDQDQRPTR